MMPHGRIFHLHHQVKWDISMTEEHGLMLEHGMTYTQVIEHQEKENKALKRELETMPTINKDGSLSFDGKKQFLDTSIDPQIITLKNQVEVLKGLIIEFGTSELEHKMDELLKKEDDDTSSTK